MTIILSLHTKKLALQAVVLLAFLLAALYVVQVNLVTDTAYLLSSQKRALQELEGNLKALEAKHAARISFESFDSIARDLGFEKITRMGYAQVAVPHVAQTGE